MKKSNFKSNLVEFVGGLREHISTDNEEWSIKGFIDIYKNVYTLSSDTKIISKILEIHLFPRILEFANGIEFDLVLAEHQNYYPDISFVNRKNNSIKFAVDFKTTYRLPDKPHLCNGFTLGSHGEYFTNRESTKNIQFPYSSYLAHFCLGIIYDRVENATIDETKTYKIENLKSITSVVRNFQFFVSEKWQIASDKGGSGNTANIGSIKNIEDIIKCKGMFSKLGEKWFDDYWMNFQKITISDGKSGTRKINTLEEFVKYRKGDVSKIVPMRNNKS